MTLSRFVSFIYLVVYIVLKVIFLANINKLLRAEPDTFVCHIFQKRSDEKNINDARKKKA